MLLIGFIIRKFGKLFNRFPALF